MTLSPVIKLDRKSMGQAAATLAAERIQNAIEQNGEANLILATGSSQFEMLDELVKADVDWSKVTGFHLDEYAGITSDHPASFVRYLKERFFDQVAGIREFHFIAGQVADLKLECQRLSDLINQAAIDVACIGIGENGHLAFNDPPADFETEQPYIVVQLDAACRQQQVGEGWFPTLDDVPLQAISMSVKQILKSKCLVVSVPDERKAAAVRDSIYGDVNPNVPASILQTHPDCHLFLDASAAILVRSP